MSWPPPEIVFPAATELSAVSGALRTMVPPVPTTIRLTSAAVLTVTV